MKRGPAAAMRAGPVAFGECVLCLSEAPSACGCAYRSDECVAGGIIRRVAALYVEGGAGRTTQRPLNRNGAAQVRRNQRRNQDEIAQGAFGAVRHAGARTVLAVGIGMLVTR